MSEGLPSDDKIAQIAAAVELGMKWTGVPELVDVQPSQLKRWQRMAQEEPLGQYGKLRRAVRMALSRFEKRCLTCITAAAQGVVSEKYDADGRIIERKFDNRQWTAAAWLLERRFPDRWSRPEIRIKTTSRRELIVRVTAAQLDAKYGDAIRSRIERDVKAQMVEIEAQADVMPSILEQGAQVASGG